MDSKLKKLLSLAGLFCIMGVAQAAQGDMQNDHHQRPAGQMDDSGRYREITPNAGPRVTDGVDVFVDADFIWWYTEIDGLGYAMTGYDNRSANTPPAGKLYNPNWKWEPGFKVSLGLALGHDGWDLGAEYTWLRYGTQSGTVTSDNLYPMWNIANNYTNFTANPGATGSLAAASYKTSLHFNVIDLELGRNYFVSQHLKMRPFVGLKGAWTTNDYQVTYTRRASSSANDTDLMKNNQDHWGIGLRTGLDTAWHFTKEWSIYGDVAFSALWSRFKVTRTDTDADSSSTNTVFNVTNTVHTLKPVLEMGMGLRWETWFSDNDYHFLVQAGWEQQLWYEYNQHFSVYEEANRGDLTLQGLTVKVRFDF